MKSLIFILRILFLISLVNIILSCKAGENDNGKSSRIDSPIVGKNDLPLYRVNPCLLNLLESIVSSNKKNYSSHDFFYSLSLKKTANLKLLTVNVYLWSNLRNLKYVGAVKIKNATFLCEGDIENDELFKKDESRVMTITIKSEKEEPEIFQSIEEPVLSGRFVACEGVPIHLEIYTKEKINGY